MWVLVARVNLIASVKLETTHHEVDRAIARDRDAARKEWLGL